jgi:hypothetical protein
MVRLERSVLAAVRTLPVPSPQEFDPLASRVRTVGADLAGAPSGMDDLPNVAMLPSVLGEVDASSRL